jgi:hypothetical protein
MWNVRRHRPITLAALALAAFAINACDEDPVAEEHEELPAEMRLTVGSQTVTVTSNGTVTGGPIVVPVGTTSVSAVFITDDGDTFDASAAEFELRASSLDGSIASFTGTGPTTGSIVGSAAGQTALRFELYHLIEQHEDFGPHQVPVTVQ